MRTQLPGALIYGAAFVSGAALFFLCFAAIFNGSWPLLVVPLALTLAAPAVPWVLWLFPASVSEAGLLRALLWPGLAAATGGLAWLGASATARGLR
jgi:hypothetical protein